MTTMLLDRALLASGLIVFGWLLYQLVSWVILKQVQVKAHSSDLFSRGKQTILYFTTPDCAACKSVQRPALNRLEEKLGNHLQVVEINAYEQPEVARDWKVLSVPTTFIIDAQGNPRQVNYGVTPAEKLIEQLKSIESEDFQI